jgi:hypothetical protein
VAWGAWGAWAAWITKLHCHLAPAVERASPLLEDGRGEALPTFWFDPSAGTTSGLNFKIDKPR